MHFVLNDYYRDIPDEELLLDMKQVAQYLKKNWLYAREYKQYGGKYSTSTISHRFGGWTKACVLCGFDLEKNQRMNISQRELFKDIEDTWIRLGRQPTSNDIRNGHSKYSLNSYIRFFGSWRKALESFVEFINLDESTSVLDIAQKKTVHADDIRGGFHQTQRDANLRLRFLVMKRDCFKCRICGASPASNPDLELHIDHIIPWSVGGETVIDNLQTLCSKCNLGKSNIEIQKT